MMFLVFRMCVKWARVTLLFKVTSLIRIPFLLLPALSRCGSSGPLPFQGCRLGLLGHSFLLSPWGLSLVDVCFSVCAAMLISQPRHFKSFVALRNTLQMHSYASRTPLSWLPYKCFQNASHLSSISSVSYSFSWDAVKISAFQFSVFWYIGTTGNLSCRPLRFPAALNLLKGIALIGVWGVFFFFKKKKLTVLLLNIQFHVCKIHFTHGMRWVSSFRRVIRR